MKPKAFPERVGAGTGVSRQVPPSPSFFAVSFVDGGVGAEERGDCGMRQSE